MCRVHARLDASQNRILWSKPPVQRMTAEDIGFKMFVFQLMALRGPAALDPSEISIYPRGRVMIEDAVGAISHAWRDGHRRMRVTFGAMDSADDLRMAMELGERWEHGYALVLVSEHDVERGKQMAMQLGLSRKVSVAELGCAAKLRDNTLVVVVRPDSFAKGGKNPVTHLQYLCARLDDKCAVVILNPNLLVPSCFAPGLDVVPMILGDFEHVYCAEADALSIKTGGIAVYRRWPLPSWRLYERTTTEDYHLIGAVRVTSLRGRVTFARRSTASPLSASSARFTGHVPTSTSTTTTSSRPTNRLRMSGHLVLNIRRCLAIYLTRVLFRQPRGEKREWTYHTKNSRHDDATNVTQRGRSNDAPLCDGTLR